MTNTENEMPQTDKQQIVDDNDKAPNLFQVMASVLAAFFGVQSSKNKERDFKHGNHKVFIIVGIMMTLTFLLTVVVIVQIVLN
ncbi:MAG: DUF2970 domain-containing protein [Oceanicoccus sp.]